MQRFNSDVENIKQQVLIEVIKMCYGNLGEDYAQSIPHKIIPGLKPRYRCCIFKERAIIDQRVRLARGLKQLDNNRSLDTINVIREACHGCPINRFNVTANCQKCLAKNCIKTCRFGAISVGVYGAVINQNKCRECGKCVTSCPYNAITDTQRPCIRSCQVKAINYDRNKIAVIDKDKCVLCGHCIKDCPFGAIVERSDIVKIINDINAHKNSIAIIAPAIEGQFGTVNIAGIKEAIKKLGFNEVFEAGLGADAVAMIEGAEIVEKVVDGKKVLTSCCPSFYNLVEKHYPMLSDLISETVSPMVATSRYIRTKHNNATITFISPCIAKRQEAKKDIDGNVDYVLSFEELQAMFIARDITPVNAEGNSSSTIFGRGFAVSGGVSQAVAKAIKESEHECPNFVIANGIEECKKQLLDLRLNRFSADVLEGMSCVDGCIGGSATLVSPLTCKKNRQTINELGKEAIHDNVKNIFDESLPLSRKKVVQ